MSDHGQTQGYTYNGTITFDGMCKETGKPVCIKKHIEYYAGRAEPDTERLMTKVLRKGSVS
jgi:hypothetical protein